MNPASASATFGAWVTATGIVTAEAGFVPIIAGFLALALFVAASSLAAVRFGGLPRR